MTNEHINIIRLHSGIDIITICEYNNMHNTVKLINPMEILINRDMDTSQDDLVVRPWLPIEAISENSCTIKTDDIFTTLNPTEGFTTFYKNIIEKINELLYTDDNSSNTDIAEVVEFVPNTSNKTVVH